MKGSTGIAIAVVAILLVGGLFFANQFGWIQLGSLWGFSVLSLDQADFMLHGTTLPDGSFWNKPLWIAHISQDGFAQRLTGEFSSAQIGASSGETPDQSFKVEMSLEKQSCEYPLRKESNIAPLSDFDLEVWGCFGNSATEAQARCPNLFDYGDIGVATCWCIDQSNLAMAVNLNLESPYTHTVGYVYVGNDDEWSTTVGFDSHESETISKFIIPDKVYMRFEGYHGTDFQCDDSDQIYAWWSLLSGSTLDGAWHIGSSERYRTYKHKYDDLVVRMQSASGFSSSSEIQAIIDDVNNARVQAMVEIPWGEIESTTSLSNAKIIRDIPSPIKFPQYAFYIDADYLGVETMPPDIYIDGAAQTDSCFEGTGTIEITLRNAGYSGSTYISITDCPEGFITSPAKLFPVEAGESTTITRAIDASVSEKTTGTCTVVSNDGFHVRERTLIVCATPFVSCTPGQTQCFADETIRQCNVLGTGWSVIEDCKATCGNLNAVCDDSDGTPECRCDGGTPAPDNNWLFIITIIGISVGLLLGYAFTRDTIWAVVGGVIGGVLGYLIGSVVAWYFGLAWWQQLLLGLGGIAGGGIMIYLFGGAFLTFILVIIYALRK